MKIFALILFIYAAALFLGDTYEGNSGVAAWSGTGTGGYAEAPRTTIETVFNFDNAMQVVNVLGVVSIPVPNGDWFKSLFKLLTLQFTFVTGDWMMFYWIVLAPIALMGVLSFVILVYGMITGNLTWT